MVRNLSFAVLAAATLTYSSFSANAAASDTQRAYDAARRCYVANGHVYDSFKQSGDAANTSLFEAKAKKSFDLAYSYGHQLHLSNDEIATDIHQTTDVELRKLLADSAYLTTVAKDCKYWGMM